MIFEIIVRTCPECASESIIKNGHDYPFSFVDKWEVKE